MPWGVYGYYVFTRGGWHSATLCEAHAVEEAKGNRRIRNAVARYVREEYWRQGVKAPVAKAYCETHSISRKYDDYVVKLLSSGKARTDDGDEFYPITDNEEFETRQHCEHGCDLQVPVLCCKLNPEKHGLEHCECDECSRPEDTLYDPLLIDRVELYVTNGLDIRAVGFAHDEDGERHYQRDMEIRNYGDVTSTKRTMDLVDACWKNRDTGESLAPSLVVEWGWEEYTDSEGRKSYHSKGKPERIWPLQFTGDWKLVEADNYHNLFAIQHSRLQYITESFLRQY